MTLQVTTIYPIIQHFTPPFQSPSAFLFFTMPIPPLPSFHPRTHHSSFQFFAQHPRWVPSLSFRIAPSYHPARAPR